MGQLTTAPARPAGHRWEAFARSVIARYGGLCHLCDHGGARQVDHLEPVTERPDLAWNLSNCRPAHGTPGNRCPVCGIACNQVRSAFSVQRARRIIAERIADHQAKRKPVPAQDTGRPWLASRAQLVVSAVMRLARLSSRELFPDGAPGLLLAHDASTSPTSLS